MNDKEEDHTQHNSRDENLQNFHQFQFQLLSMRPWWQKTFDWLDNHLVASIAIAVFGSILLLVPTIFIIVTAMFCINTENEIKCRVSEMSESWDNRNSTIPPEDGLPFITNSFIAGLNFHSSWLKPLWLSPEIERKRETLRKYYFSEVEERKPPYIKLAEKQRKTIKKFLTLAGIAGFRGSDLVIEKEDDKAYIAYTTLIENKKTFDCVCVFMSFVFGLTSDGTEIVKKENFNSGCDSAAYKAKFPVIENNINRNEAALNLFVNANQSLSKVRDLISTIKSSQETDILKEEIIGSLNLAVGENNEVILQSSLSDKTVYDTYPTKDFSRILEERTEWLKNLKELLVTKIGSGNFTLEYNLNKNIEIQSSNSETHETNHPFSFNLTIKPDGFDSLLNASNTVANNITKTI